MIDLGPRARVVFAAAYFAAQGALIGTAPRRAERAFGFQMFNESSTLAVHLSRRIDSIRGNGTTLIDVKDGEWAARDAYRQLHRFSWRDRVTQPALSTFDTTLFASYGVAAQLARFQAALDDVASHIPEDSETRALVADITVRRNGHEAYVVQLTSAPR